jgi:hypothetical protein
MKLHKILSLTIPIVALAACTGMGVGLPQNMAFFNVRNNTNQPLRLLLEDTPRDVERNGQWVKVTRVWDRGELKPGQKHFFQWPFAAETGRVSAVVEGDTTRSPWVRPWTKKTWHWNIESNTFVVRTEDK